MHRFAKALLICAFLCLWPMAVFAAEQDWNGNWTGYVCPKGTSPDPARCSSFFLRLHSRNAKVCGSHVYATAGAKQMDEGGTPSLLARLDGTTAKGTVESTRGSPATSIAVTLQMSNGELRWERTENPPGDYLLPRNVILSRSKQGSMLSAMFEQGLAAACSAHLDMPAEKVGPPATIR